MSKTVRGTIAAIVAAVAVAFVTADASKATTYGNSEFGIVLAVPDGALLCRIPLAEHDHGPYMLLDATSENGCHDLEHNRSIDIFASYNVAADTKKLSNLRDGAPVSLAVRARLHLPIWGSRD